MIRSILCDYGNAYVPFKENITVTNTTTEAAPNIRNKNARYNNYALFTD